MVKAVLSVQSKDKKTEKKLAKLAKKIIKLGRKTSKSKGKKYIFFKQLKKLKQIN